MLAHVVTKVLQQCHFLGEAVWKDVHSVKMFGSVSLDVLHVPGNTHQRYELYMVLGKTDPPSCYAINYINRNRIEQKSQQNTSSYEITAALMRPSTFQIFNKIFFHIDRLDRMFKTVLQ